MYLQRSFSKSHGSYDIVVILKGDNHTINYSDLLDSRFDYSELLVARLRFLIKCLISVRKNTFVMDLRHKGTRN
jgi:hypothetical protein